MRALLIEDKQVHVVHARRRLAKAGIDVKVCTEARSGIETAKQLLNRAFEPQLDLIILDWLLPHPHSPSLEATVVAAELIRSMDEAEIHPVHIVVLTQDPSAERREDALGIGCSMVLDKPLSQEAADELRLLAQRPTSYPLSQPNYRRILRFVRPTLEMLYAGEQSTGAFYWSRKAIKRLLEAQIINDLSREERRWIEEHGGFAAIKAFVTSVDIADDRLRKLRLLMLENPTMGWDFFMRALATNKNYIYDYRNMLFDVLAEKLNALGAA